MRNIQEPLKKLLKDDIEGFKKVASLDRKMFTNGADRYIQTIKDRFLDKDIDKKTAIIELKSQVELTNDFLDILKFYQDTMNRSELYRNLVLDCKYARRALKKEMRLFENDILPKAKSKPQKKHIQPIHWRKGEESLRQFLDNIKKAGLIESREIDDIIQEHIYVDGQAPTKEPQPIKWLIESKYLAYLMHRLAEEFIINIKGKKHQLTASHFISSEGNKLKSLASQLSQVRNEKSSNKNIKMIESIIHELKS